MLSSPSRSAEVLRILALIALCGLLFFFRLGASPLWEIDEGMHAATAAEMLRSGDWLTPTFNGEPFFDKPVMYTWLTALSLRLFGFTELAARLPVALLGLGTVLTTYLLGRKFYGELAGFLGGAVLASAGMFIVLSRAVVHDMCLAFFLTLALALFHVGVDAEQRRKLYLAGAWLAVGFAILTKGPAGLVLPVGIVGAFLLLVWNPGLVLKSSLGAGIAILVVVVVPWNLLMHLEHPDYLRYFIVEQHFGNIGGEGVPRHEEPVWFYLPVLLGGFFPWTFFLPAAIFVVRPDRRTHAGRTTVFLWAWVGVTFLLYSAATSKLPTYILPMLPPLALLVGAAWARFLESPTLDKRRWVLVGSALLVLVGVGTLAYSLIAPPVHLNEKYGVNLAHVVWLGALLAMGFGGSLALLWHRRTGLAFGAVVATMAGLFLLAITLILPCIDPYRSTKAIALPLDRELPPGENLVFLEAIVGVADSALFYTDRRATVLEDEWALREFLASENRVFGLAKRRPLEAMWPLPGRPTVLLRAGKRVLFSNRGGSLPGP